MNSHPELIEDFVLNETRNKSDGMPQRFAFCAPRPIVKTFNELRSIEQPKMPLSVVFAVIMRMNCEAVKYVFDGEALKLYEKRFDEHQQIIRLNSGRGFLLLV